MRYVRPIKALVASAMIAVGLGAAAAPTKPKFPTPPRFTITELTAPDADENTSAITLNDKGQVVFAGKGSVSYLWERGKATRSLGKLEGSDHLQPIAINNAGQIVGISWGKDDPNYRKRRAFLWENDTVRDLGTPEGETSEAFDINNRGEVFVTSYAFGNKAQPNYITKSSAFLWTAAKGFQPLPDRFMGHGVACALNDRGQILGNSFITSEELQDSFAGLGRLDLPDTDGVIPFRAFLYDSQTFQRLPIQGSWSTQAEAFNNRGDILLTAELLGPKRSYGVDLVSGGLYLWRDGKATPLIANTGGSRQVGWMGLSSINDAGDVVTTTYSTQGNERKYQAVLYRNKTLYSLDDCILQNSGWHLSSVRRINNRGEILGTGRYNGKSRAFLLTPIVSAAK